jgi:hypothetical protein
MKSWEVDEISKSNRIEGMVADKDPLLFIPISEGVTISLGEPCVG